jgi:hypothetical protein
MNTMMRKREGHRGGRCRNIGEGLLSLWLHRDAVGEKGLGQKENVPPHLVTATFFKGRQTMSNTSIGCHGAEGEAGL